MNAQRTSRTAIAGLALAAVLGASAGAFIAGVLPTQDGMPEAARLAWSERLTQYAQSLHQERVNDAYRDRLMGPVRERANDAWTDRLNGIADAQDLRGMSDRAAQAWTDRLNGMADAYAAR